jgi:hypothetical protein
MGRLYRTMQGKDVDMEKLMRQHELMPAIGNAKVNARGDELGPGGKIIRKRESVMNEYYENNPKSKKEGAKIIEPVAAQSHSSQSGKKLKPIDLEDNNES